MRHPVNATQLVFGLVFLGIAGTWSLQEVGALASDSSKWLFPLILIAAGTAGLAASMLKSWQGSRPTAGTEGFGGEDDYERDGFGGSLG